MVTFSLSVTRISRCSLPWGFPWLCESSQGWGYQHSKTLLRLCCLLHTFPTHSLETLLNNWLCTGVNMWGYIIMLSFPRHIYSSRRTSLPNNGGFTFKTWRLAKLVKRGDWRQFGWGGLDQMTTLRSCCKGNQLSPLFGGQPTKK